MWQQNSLGQFRGTKIPQKTKKMTLKANCLPIAHWEYFYKLFKAAVSAIKKDLQVSWKIRQYLLRSVVQKEKKIWIWLYLTLKFLRGKQNSVEYFCNQYVKMRKQRGQMTLGQRRHPEGCFPNMKGMPCNNTHAYRHIYIGRYTCTHTLI